MNNKIAKHHLRSNFLNILVKSCTSYWRANPESGVVVDFSIAFILGGRRGGARLHT